jgi:hypothetical protein
MYPNQNPNKATSPKKPAALNPSAMRDKTTASIKTSSPEIRVGLGAAKKPKMIDVTSMPKDKKRIIKGLRRKAI